MQNTLLFTGFPGFLGRELLPALLVDRPGTRAVCLVQDKYAEQARSALSELEAGDRSLAGRIELASGDITLPDLGLRDPSLFASVREVFHLAAIYDLSVPRDFALRVNVDGTRHVLDFAERCTRFERLQYVSTCYVSGRYTGIFSEKDLEKGQPFNNFYEETKHLAEVLVRERMERGLPASIYRPSIVVGDSKTGATQKLDGPYFFLRWLLRQPKYALLPVIGDPTRFRFNVVPRDFVVSALAYLSRQDSSAGRTFQLADHAPPTCAEALEIMARAAERRPIHVHLPLGLAKLATRRIPGVERLLKIPPTLIDYMAHPTHYLNQDTLQALAPAGLKAPPFESYAPQLAAFVRTHLGMTSAALA